MSDLAALISAVVLLIGNAFFVGAEFALVSARSEQLEPLAAAGSRRARKALVARQQLSLMMSGAQLGITVCSLGLGAVGEPAVAHLLEKPFAAAGLPDQLLHPLAFGIALMIVVWLHMVLGEMVPKNIALAGPVRSALWLGPALLLLVRAARPLIAALNALSNLILRRVARVEPQDDAGEVFTTEQVADLIAESHEEGLLDDEERELMTSTVALPGRTASSVLLDLDRVVTVAGGETAARVEELSVRTGYSRFPVQEEGRLTGYVHVKDILTGRYRDDDPLPVAVARPLIAVGADQPLLDVLRAMQAEGTHLAAVHGEAGDPLGVVALEDVLEELVGQVSDDTHRELPADTDRR